MFQNKCVNLSIFCLQYIHGGLKMNFAQRITTLRKQKGLTQAKLANDLGLSQAQLSNYEQGTREPNIETFISIANYFNVSLDYLFARTTQSVLSNNLPDHELMELLTLEVTFEGKKLTTRDKEKALGILRILFEDK